eukprot:5119885-Lingulodinium_polyedra.AAC.2
MCRCARGIALRTSMGQQRVDAKHSRDLMSTFLFTVCLASLRYALPTALAFNVHVGAGRPPASKRVSQSSNCYRSRCHAHALAWGWGG